MHLKHCSWLSPGVILFAVLQTLVTPEAVADREPPPDRELVLLNWSEYMDPELIAEFEQRFHVNVREAYFESDDLRDAMMLETDGQGYDLALVNGVSVDIYRQHGWLAEIDSTRLPNLQHINQQWRTAFPSTGEYAVPYFWGTLGIAYRNDLVKRPPESWLDLFRPEEYLRGKIAMIESSRDALGMSLKALGYSANSEEPDQIRAAAHLLGEQKPFVRSYVYLALTEESALVSGEVAMAMMFSGDALMVSEFHEDIQYLVPREGGNLWCDYLVVLESSKNKDLAWAFINFLNEPENAARLAQYVYYATPNRAAEVLLPKEFRADPIIYPDSGTLEKSEAYRIHPPRAQRLRNSAFVSILD
jgi:spermidine/putrescine transport system substrate-binding protein